MPAWIALAMLACAGFAWAVPARAEAAAPARAGLWEWPLEPHVVLEGFALGPYSWSAGHRGVDLAASPGEPVKAPATGVVTFAGVVAGRGVLVLTHESGHGIRSSFEPVRASVAVGTRITPGEVIARVTPAASRIDHCSSGRCLHWGVRRFGTYIDPLAFVAPQRVVLLPVGNGPDQLASASLALSCRTAFVCIWQMRDSVTPSTRPISARVSPS